MEIEMVVVGRRNRQHVVSANQRVTKPRIVLTALALAADCGKRRVNAHLVMIVCTNTKPLKRVELTTAVALERRSNKA